MKYFFLSLIVLIGSHSNVRTMEKPANNEKQAEQITQMREQYDAKLKELEERLAKFDRDIIGIKPVNTPDLPPLIASAKPSGAPTPEQNQIYKEKLAELQKRLENYDVKIKELEERFQKHKHDEIERKQTNTPDAPPLIASAKLPIPPTPEKPQSFFENNKKALVAGGIGLGILTAGGIMWKASRVPAWGEQKAA